MKESYKVFYKKICELELKTGFRIAGTVTDINAKGIFFESTQKTSFIAWDDILTLIPTTSKVNYNE